MFASAVSDGELHLLVIKPLIGWFRMLGLLVLLLLLTIRFKKYYRIAYLALRLPGPPAYPIIGNSYMVFNNERLFYLGSHVREKYGPIIRAWMSIFPLVFIVEPRHIQKVLFSGKHIEKMSIYRWMGNFVGRGLVTSNGHLWKKHRRLMQPAFTFQALGDVVSHFENGGRELVDDLRHTLTTGCNLLNVTPLVNQCIFRILSETICGISLKNRRNSDWEVMEPFRRGINTMQERLHRPWLMMEYLYRFTNKGRQDSKQGVLLETSSRKIIAERKRKLSAGDKCRCLLDFMINIGLTDEECINEVSTFMLAGQESVAGALTFALYLLAQHPEIQQKAAAEVDKVFKDCIVITQNEVRQLSYLEQCIKETLRLFPSIPAFGRQLVEDLVLDDYILPAGTEVVISPYATHRLAELFPDPEKYDPERFSVHESRRRHSCAFIPFSAGPRNCIGYKFAIMELQTIIAIILHNYRLSLPKEKEKLSLKYKVTIRASGGVWIQFTERKE